MPVDPKLADEAHLRHMVRFEDMILDLQKAKNLGIRVLEFPPRESARAEHPSVASPASTRRRE